MYQNSQRFRLVPRPEGVSSHYSLLVVDGDGRPHLPLTRFYDKASQNLSVGAARAYLNALLPYFSYLTTDEWRRCRGDRWDSPPEAVHESIHDYLVQRLACKVKQRDTYENVSLTADSPSTVRICLSALKLFYTIMYRIGWYPYAQPLTDPLAHVLREVEDEERRAAGARPRMPQQSGVEEQRPHRPSENYFRLVDDKWVVEPIDDPALHTHLLKHFKQAKLSLRDQIVVRIAYETGARIGEILGLTVGDWRRCGCKLEAKAFSKGSRGRRVKTIRFSTDTAKMLHQYTNTDRAQLDPQHRRLEQLEDHDPLFVSKRSNPYTYGAFKPHWKALCCAAQIELNIHGLRHWYVTQAMREIAETAKSEEGISLGKEGLVRYMAWRSPETLKTYEHYFTYLSWVKTQDQLHRRLYGEGTHQIKQPENSSPQVSQGQSTNVPKQRTHSPVSQREEGGWETLLALGGKQHE
jgi:integrase